MNSITQLSVELKDDKGMSMAKAHNPDNGTICAADVSEMMGRPRSAAFNVIRLIDNNEPRYIQEGGNKIQRHVTKQRNWVIDRAEAERFVKWYMAHINLTRESGPSKKHMAWIEEQRAEVLAEMRGRGVSDKVLRMVGLIENDSNDDSN